MIDQKKHWYCFAFRMDKQSQTVIASTYIGYHDKRVTLPRIAEAKEFAGIDKGAVVIGVSYLGRMTKGEFDGNPDDAP